MRLKIEDLGNPAVEKATDGSIPTKGALVHIFFEPHPRFVLVSPNISITYFPGKNASVRFVLAQDESKKWDPTKEVPLVAWSIIITFIAIESYLADEIGYTPQLMGNILNKFRPSK